MQVESSASPLLTIDEYTYSNWLMRPWLTNSFNKKSWIATTVVLLNMQVKTNILLAHFSTVHAFPIEMKYREESTQIKSQNDHPSP